MSLYKVKLFALDDDSCTPELIGQCCCQPNESYSDFRGRLEATSCIEWPFHFFDFEEGCRIKPRMESLDTIGQSVYIVKILDDGKADRSKRRRVEATGTSGEGLQFSPVTNMTNSQEDDHPAESLESPQLLELVDQILKRSYRTT
jgi:hypothetical protein